MNTIECERYVYITDVYLLLKEVSVAQVYIDWPIGLMVRDLTAKSEVVGSIPTQDKYLVTITQALLSLGSDGHV